MRSQTTKQQAKIMNSIFIKVLIRASILMTLIHLMWIGADNASQKIISAYMNSSENVARIFYIQAQGGFSADTYKNLTDADKAALIQTSRTKSEIKNIIWLSGMAIEIIFIVVFAYSISSLTRVRTQS